MLQGRITSDQGSPISGALITVLNRSLQTTTNSNGEYQLSLNPGTYKLQFSAVGYAPEIQEIKIDANTKALNKILTNSNLVLGEVVVTASKREEALVQVPVAVTSLNADRIENTRTWSLSGLTALVPNYNYQELGVPFQQVQSIRGIQVFSENPAVSTYIDDVNQLDILANGFALTDLERIEVLRGPQGTLFGRNAMGGVVNLITRKPTNKTSGFAEVSLGNLGLQRYSLGVRTPLIANKLFFGVNALYQRRDGYWKNDTTGTGALDGSTLGKTVGGENNFYGNIYLKWLASSRLNFTLNLKGQRDWSDNTGFFVSQRDVKEAFAKPDVINLSRIGQHERQIVNASLVTKYEAKSVSITSISAFQTIGLSFKDIDFGGLFYHSFYEKQIGEMLPPQRVLSQEIRIQSTGASKLQYTGGVFGFHQFGYEPSTNNTWELTPNLYAISRNKSDNLGLAGFGEMSYQITKRIKATGGLRYDYERRESIFNGIAYNPFPDPDAIFSNNALTFVRPDTSLSGTYSALSPKLAFSYEIGAQSQAYITYNRGFRAGGINAQRLPQGINTTYNPEFSDNFELGYKALLANKKLSFSASAFYIQWQSLQFFNLVAPGVFARENVGDARSMGVEVEVTAIPIRGLQLEGSLGINETNYEAFNLKRFNFLTNTEFVTPIGGNRLSNAPRHTLFLAGQYEFSFGKKLKLTARSEVRNMGSYFTDIQNKLEQPTYTVINGHLALVYSRYAITLWGQNLANERFLAFGNADSSLGFSLRTAMPRTVGVTLQAKF